MKFLRGMVLGTLVAGGIAVMVNESKGMNKRKMMRKGKQIVKKMGII